MNRKNVAILIFNDVEVLDFAGPFEVFSITGKRDGSDPFNVYTVAETTPILARNGLSINPHYTLESCPTPDILLVPGGGGYRSDGTPFGTRKEIDNQLLLDWIEQCSKSTEKLLSVCTGALLLARIGLLEGLVATTHHGAIAQLTEMLSPAQVHPKARIADNGHIILSAGISAGIDMSLYVVAQLLGMETALETATYMEYDWNHAQLKVVK
ncbi:MAG: DJ-1/PfpI family protein [Phormidesmis sp. RL_2_1]|nr:DJ-1/PfpI family protein [Phormidesmis sp. RL_2_1]